MNHTSTLRLLRDTRTRDRIKARRVAADAARAHASASSSDKCGCMACVLRRTLKRAIEVGAIDGPLIRQAAADGVKH